MKRVQLFDTELILYIFFVYFFFPLPVLQLTLIDVLSRRQKDKSVTHG